MKQYENVIKH